MRFVDLFAGLGGFHAGLARLRHECVFASELNDELRSLYVQNFPKMAGRIHGDIREVKSKIPPHDILCAGFPCQPFSKSGEQLGVHDKTRGTLFHELLDILEQHKPRYFIFENVGNFERHDKGNTWKIVKNSLIDLGYDVRGTEHVTPVPRFDWRDRSGTRKRRLPESAALGRPINLESIVAKIKADRTRGHGLISPHHLGFPQNRERFFIVGSRSDLPEEPFPPANRERITTLSGIVTPADSLTPEEIRETKLTPQQIQCIKHWNALLRAIPANVPLPSFPIWGDEIGASYPYEERTPWSTSLGKLRGLAHSHRFASKAEIIAALPSYAREEHEQFRDWKIQFIKQNREWFLKIKPHIPAGWVKGLWAFPPSLRKLEWNVKGGERNLWRHILQFRPSGLRARRYDRAPALVAMTATQIPILGPERRFLTRTEGLRVQGFPDNHQLPKSRAAAFSALGNAVHVGVVAQIAAQVLGQRSRANTQAVSTNIARGLAATQKGTQS